ncbi:MAG: histidine phosphatase family protein [Candidatus Magnetobacterium sp. LHC-1]|uniref:Histidine phosphatase family protein n=1 Tax=Candidatus Magnetobacterium casense TaxID=1455061 RepID=A0ABS6S1A2_9BACT|nr:histidine phosphatase family protein [Candidatus Magnetobacterium casensis]MBF0608296.1 histidine phosphatase family protein [Nitrospirota bacterium]MBV6342629.1 histidine phosphatase family protein [Candidatus Magnetobacterium casensis]
MTTTVYLLRHGKTIGDNERRYKGHTDVPLSDEGIKQAARSARYIKKRECPAAIKGHASTGIQGLYCSDLSRTIESAEMIGKPFNLSPIKVEGLRERHFGRWEGMTFDEVSQTYPQEFDLWAKNPLAFSPIDGESTLDVSARVMPVFYDIIAGHKNEAIVIVAHGGVNRVILATLLGVPLENLFRIEQDFNCINIIEFHEDLPVVKALNYVAEFN